MTLETKRSLLKMTITTRTLTPNTSGTYHSLFSEVHDDEYNYIIDYCRPIIIYYFAKINNSQTLCCKFRGSGQSAKTTKVGAILGAGCVCNHGACDCMYTFCDKGPCIIITLCTCIDLSMYRTLPRLRPLLHATKQLQVGWA